MLHQVSAWLYKQPGCLSGTFSPKHLLSYSFVASSVCLHPSSEVLELVIEVTWKHNCALMVCVWREKLSVWLNQCAFCQQKSPPRQPPPGPQQCLLYRNTMTFYNHGTTHEPETLRTQRPTLLSFEQTSCGHWCLATFLAFWWHCHLVVGSLFLSF